MYVRVLNSIFVRSWRCQVKFRKKLHSNHKPLVRTFVNKPHTSLKQQFKPKYQLEEYKHRGKMTENKKWMDVGRYNVFPWSIAGLESCVVVQGKGDRLDVAFDMGQAVRESVNCEHVFISHGHIDHVAGIPLHASRRSLFSLKPATYHVMPQLGAPLRDVAAATARLHGDGAAFAELQLNPVTEQDTVQLPGGYFVRPFPTHHRVASQGYLLYRRARILKPEFQGLPGPEIGQLVKDGVDIHDERVTPEIAYTGDTTFDVFTSPSNPDLLNVKVLITESTYIDDNVDKQGRMSLQKARDWGHCHLHEFVKHEELFRNVEHLVLVHMSDKYPPGYIERTLQQVLPESMQGKVRVNTYTKEMMSK